MSLGDFFYRRLKEGVRPVDDMVLVSVLSVLSVLEGGLRLTMVFFFKPFGWLAM